MLFVKIEKKTLSTTATESEEFINYLIKIH